MFAGHVGAALAIGRAERQVNVGVFVTAALLLDLVLWLLVLLGWESVIVPADFATTHQVAFDFPYSHSLLAGAAWSVLAGIAAYIGYGRLKRAKLRTAALIAAAVFSHWLLDALVHAPELPLAGAGSVKVGLGLWQNMPLALITETAIVLAGLSLFIADTRLSRAKAIWLSLLSMLLAAFTAIGMTIAPPPPSAPAMAGSSLATLIVVCALVCWLGKASR